MKTNKAIRTLNLLFVLLISTILFNSCCAPNEYNETIIEGGDLIVETLRPYVEADASLTEDHKRIILESCEQYLRLLKQDK